MKKIYESLLNVLNQLENTKLKFLISAAFLHDGAERDYYYFGIYKNFLKFLNFSESESDELVHIFELNSK